MFEEVHPSEEDQEQIQRLLDMFRKERAKSAFNTEEYRNILGNPTLTTYLEETYILDSVRHN